MNRKDFLEVVTGLIFLIVIFFFVRECNDHKQQIKLIELQRERIDRNEKK